MRKIFISLVVTVLVLGASLVSAKHIKLPKLPASDKFEQTYEGKLDCGFMKTYAYQEGDDAIWHKFYLENNNNPLLVAKATSVTVENWLDKNRDGHVDEYFASSEALEGKYPTPCDAVKGSGT